jgi:hypothetical protein
VFDSVPDFVSAREFLTELLTPTHAGLFPFGGDGAGNLYCVPPTDVLTCRIHFVDHETAKVSKGKEFTDWLRSVVAKVLRGVRRRPPNERKVWAVQFTFGRTSYDVLAKLLASVGSFKEIDRRWTNAGASKGSAPWKERWIELNGQRLKLVWDTGMLFFDMRESLAKGPERSQVRKLNALFKEKCPRYQLVDYGALDSAQLEAE